jgi:tetratricopeptide (TPR) repeat protein
MNKRDSKRLLEDAKNALARGRIKTAIKKLNEVIKLDPHCLDAYFHLVLGYRRIRCYVNARINAKKVLKINPLEPNARLNLGVIEAELENEPQAIRNYNLELKLHPQCYEAHFNLGLKYLTRRRWKDAQYHFYECWKNGHKGKLRDEYLALATQHTGDISLEEKIYHQRLKENPQDCWALNNLGAIRNKQGKHKEAKSLFQKTLRNNPDNRIAKKNLKYTPKS